MSNDPAPPVSPSGADAPKGRLPRGVIRFLLLSAVALAVAAGGYWWHGRWSREGWERAEAALRRNDLAGAAAHLELHLERQPGDAAALLLAGRTARRLGLLADAERYLERCQQVGGVTEATLREWDLLRVQRGEVGEIDLRLRRTISPDHPDAPLVLEALARGYSHAGRLLAALEACDLWAKVQPDHPWPWSWRGNIYERLGNFQQALSDHRRAVEVAPTDRDMRLALARQCIQVRQPAEAVGHYEWVLGEWPDDRDALLGLAACRIDQGRPADALPLLQPVLTAAPDSQRALFLRGKAALDLQDGPGAEHRLARAVELAPDDDEALHQLILALRYQGKHAEADRLAPRLEAIRKDISLFDTLTRNVARNPDDAALRHRAGVVALRLGRHEVGVYWLQSALKARGDHGPTHAALAEHFGARRDPRAEYHRRLAEAGR